ncbi:MAG: iron ABC transporter permease [Chloroflexota bacterium]|nr:iron ABC transporter permease [Chloroflexota bacterium]
MLRKRQTAHLTVGEKSNECELQSQNWLRARFGVLLFTLICLLALSITFAVTIGPVNISASDVWKIIIYKTIGIGIYPEWPKSTEHIVWLIRLPRVLLAGLVGGGLAVVGATMQALVRNLLADPYILGVSSGASVGAVLVIVSGSFGVLGMFSLSIAAFVTGTLSFLVVLLLAQQRGHIAPNRILLAGIAVSYVCSAITSFLVVRSPDAEGVQSVLYWMLGSLCGTKWEYLTIPALVLAIGTIFLLLQSRSLNSMAMGDDTAVTLGINTNSFRRQLIIVAAIMTGAMVAVSGSIGFVGLMMPHIVRLLVGSDHRRVLPLSFFLGAIFLIWVDVLARVVVEPEELPVGIITAFLGAPFFLWLMRRSKYTFAGGC